MDVARIHPESSELLFVSSPDYLEPMLTIDSKIRGNAIGMYPRRSLHSLDRMLRTAISRCDEERESDRFPKIIESRNKCLIHAFILNRRPKSEAMKTEKFPPNEVFLGAPVSRRHGLGMGFSLTFSQVIVLRISWILRECCENGYEC